MSTISPDMQINNEGSLATVAVSEPIAPLEPAKEIEKIDQSPDSIKEMFEKMMAPPTREAIGYITPALKARLKEGESFYAQAHSFHSCSENIKLEMQGQGGLRRMLGGENLALIKATATGGEGEAIFTTDQIGPMISVTLGGEEGVDKLICKTRAHFAHDEGVNFTSKFVGLVKGLFGGMGLYHQEVSGKGNLFLQAEGDIEIKHLLPGEKLTIDQGFILAYTPDIEFKLKRTRGGLGNIMFSGAGFLVGDLSAGDKGGVVITQTRRDSVERELLSRAAAYGNSGSNISFNSSE